MERAEIIKALECCGAESLAQKQCRKCPYYKIFKTDTACIGQLCQDARALIRRQQSEQLTGAGEKETEGGRNV